MCKFDRTAKFVHAAQQGLTLGLASLEHPGKSLAFLSSFRRLHAFLWVSSFHQFINYWMKRADASLAGMGCLLRWMRCTCTPIKWVGMRCAKMCQENPWDVSWCAKESVSRILGQLSSEERRQRVLVVDNDLEGSCGLKKVQNVQMQPMQQPPIKHANVGHRGTWDAARSFMTFLCVCGYPSNQNYM